jgi:outer membrane protein assembly factor BamD
MMKHHMSVPKMRSALLGVLLLLVAGCGARQENLTLLPPDDLYARALEAYEARRFERATNLLELFVAQHLGDPRAPDARMMLGQAHFERREYATAATHFQRLVTDFPSHPRALEARFRICDAYFQLSPRPALDQQYTVSSLIHCESVAENFPGTPEAVQARERVTELTNRLAQKSFETGMFYFRRRAFDSAVVYFEEVLNRYPQTEHAPAALGQLVETFQRIGYVEDAAEARERLLREYPQSPQAQALRS